MFAREFLDDMLKTYSEDERKKILKDLAIVKDISFDGVVPAAELKEEPVYIASAGSPGSGKTTTLETFLRQNNLLKKVVYADPDPRALKFMVHSYGSMLTPYDFATASSNREALKKAYEKYRFASTYIAHQVLQTAFGGDDHNGPQYSIAHGTTSTSPFIGSLYERIKARNRPITLLLCSNEENTRVNAVERRETEQAFVQVSPSDLISKGIEFPKRYDTYFEYAQEIYFYWNNHLTHGNLPTPCARYRKNGNEVTFEILNQAHWKSYCLQYLKEIRQHNIPICKSFEKLMPKELLEKSGDQLSAQVMVQKNIYGGSSGSWVVQTQATLNSSAAEPPSPGT